MAAVILALTRIWKEQALQQQPQAQAAAASERELAAATLAAGVSGGGSGRREAAEGSEEEAEAGPRILCIGLGGGSLPLFLAHHIPGAKARQRGARRPRPSPPLFFSHRPVSRNAHRRCLLSRLSLAPFLEFVRYYPYVHHRWTSANWTQSSCPPPRPWVRQCLSTHPVDGCIAADIQRTPHSAACAAAPLFGGRRMLAGGAAAAAIAEAGLCPDWIVTRPPRAANAGFDGAAQRLPGLRSRLRVFTTDGAAFVVRRVSHSIAACWQIARRGPVNVVLPAGALSASSPPAATASPLLLLGTRGVAPHGTFRRHAG